MMSQCQLLKHISNWHKPPTAAEVDKYWAWTSAHKRISDLHALGFLAVAGVRPCHTSGRMARTWRVTKLGMKIIGRNKR